MGEPDRMQDLFRGDGQSPLDVSLLAGSSRGTLFWWVLRWPWVKASSQLWDSKRILSAQQAVCGIRLGPVAVAEGIWAGVRIDSLLEWRGLPPPIPVPLSSLSETQPDVCADGGT